eukprot:3944694-Amphidinium_carterae.1
MRRDVCSYQTGEGFAFSSALQPEWVAFSEAAHAHLHCRWIQWITLETSPVVQVLRNIQQGRWNDTGTEQWSNQTPSVNPSILRHVLHAQTFTVPKHLDIQ